MNQAPSPIELVTVLRIAPGGHGVARLNNGETVFVPSTTRGDRVEIRTSERLQGVLVAKQFNVIEAGPSRRPPPCPYAERCGGCDFMHMNVDAQREEKRSMLEDALVRVGGDPERPKVKFVSSEGDLGYRSRVRLHVDKAGTVGYHSERSNRLVAIERCLITLPRINDAIVGLNKLGQTDKKRLSYCSEIELRAADEAPELAARLTPRKGITLRAELYTSLFPKDALVVVADTTEDKQRTQTVQVTDEVSLRIPLAAFSQVHQALNRKLVEAVVVNATLRNHKTFVDAFAGAGNFALPLLKAGLTGEAVERSDAGLLAARSTARDLGLPFNGFSIGNAKVILEQFAKNKRRFDYLVLDPPRRGIKDVLEVCLKLSPRTIALIGCDPVAFARDLGQLVNHGGRIENLTIFDMFPETHHFESLAIVEIAD